jgi:hypothetical protein
MSGRRVRLRAATTWSTGTALAVALVLTVAPDLTRLGDAVRSPGALAGASLDQLLVWLAAVAVIACTAWLWAALTLLVARVALAPDTAAARRPVGVPRALHRWVLAASGLALVGSLVAPAHAAGTGSPDAGSHAAAGASPAADLLTGLPLPERATGPEEYVVRPGDSLWRIAADRLPTGADNAEVAATWRVLHDLNRAEIGADPDLIHPTQRLRLPGA